VARRRFIYDKQLGQLVEVSRDYVPSTDAQHVNPLARDDRSYAGLRATDGTDISSRSKHREYMRRNELTTIDDYRESWAKAQSQREQYRATGKGGAVTRQDVARAIYELESGKKAQR